MVVLNRAECRSNMCNALPVSSTATKLVVRRGLSREEAATYLGISPSKFDELRKDGRIGHAKIVDGRKVWDVRVLDEAFDSFPTEGSEAVDDWRASL